MIEIDDFGQIVRPIRRALPLGAAFDQRRRLAAGQHGCDGGEQIPAVEARRQRRRLPRDLGNGHDGGPAPHLLEQTVPRPDEMEPIRRDGHGRARPADSGIDDGEHHGPGGNHAAYAASR